MLRQGDVLLVPVGFIPRSARPVGRDEGRIVLAQGAATGHAHAIAAPWVEVLEHEETRYVRNRGKAAQLVHEEHRAIELPPGDYRVVLQREYRPGASRLVRD